MIIYQLCGKVTSVTREHAEAVFLDAKTKLHAAHDDCGVWSPVDVVPKNYSHEDAMRVCLNWLTSPTMSKRGILVTLDVWEESQGACLEVAVARACGIPIIALEEVIEWRQRESSQPAM